MAEKNTIGLYKLNTDHEELRDTNSNTEVIGQIVDLYTQKKRKKDEGFSLTAMELSDLITLDEGVSVTAYRHERGNPNAWQSFLNKAFDDVPTLYNRNHDFIVFVHDADGNLFCFTGGSANHAITEFIDVTFPIELMKRITDPEKIKQAKSRSVTGDLYARDHYYRGYSAVSATESFGQVWKDLLASIREDVWDDPDMATMLGTKKRVGVEIKSSFKIKKRISFEEVLKLITKIKEYLEQDVDEETEAAFAFLDSVMLVKGYTIENNLKQKVYETIYERVTNPDIELDYDLCNVNYDDYFGANTYKIRYKNTFFAELDTLPETEDVIDLTIEHFRDSHPEVLDSLDSFIENIEQVFIETTHDELFQNTGGKIYAHLHGEVQYEEKTYFLVDKQWYLVKDNFLTVLQNDFDTYLNADGRIKERDNLEMNAWVSGKEGPYNDGYCNNPNFIVGDRIILDGIEYFDLLYIGEEGKVYIIQVKKGFGGKARESCSQIRNSAKMIEGSLVGDNPKKLKELYSKLGNRPTAACPDRLHGITETQFISLFRDRERIYTLAIAGVANVGALVGTNSNIAKFEVLSTRDALRVVKEGDSFKVCLV